MAKKTKSAPTMTDEHKAALALGREQGRAVRAYLDALENSRPRRGRQRTPDSIRRRLEVIDEELANAEPLSRLHLIQEQMDLQTELEHLEVEQDTTELEEAFVEVAAEYGGRKGISYNAWRSVGVPAAVLRRAGVPRTM